MDTNKKLNLAIGLANSAAQKDHERQYEEALELYKRCLDNFDYIRKHESNPAIKKKVIEWMEGYITRAEVISKYLKTNNRAPTPSENDRRLSTTSDKDKPLAEQNSTDPDNNEKEKFKSIISSSIVMTKPNVKWSEVAGLENAKESIHEAVMLPTKFPDLFKGNLKPWSGILLYGPPGTGKTHLARACATDTDATFISVSSSDMLSKWQGESEKLVRALFELARQHTPSVIFIDEVDSLCTSRNSQESESSRRVKTEFLVQMDGLMKTESETRILVLGATNLPWQLDPGILRRFQRKVLIPLPDAAARKAMFELNLTETSHNLTSQDFMELANATDGFSGADISVLCRDALFQPVRKCKTATHFKRIKSDGKMYWTPCSPGDKDKTKEERPLMSIPGEELKPPVLNMYDFHEVTVAARPSVSHEEQQKHEEWTRQFGREGS